MIVSWPDWYAVGSFDLAVKQARQTLFRLLSSSQIESFEKHGRFVDRNDLGSMTFYYGHQFNLQIGDRIYNCQVSINKSSSIPFPATIPIEDSLTTQLVMARCRSAFLSSHWDEYRASSYEAIPFLIYTGMRGMKRYVAGNYLRSNGEVRLSWGGPDD